MPYYAYAWGVGFDLALASLSNVEDDLLPYTRPRRIAPRSQTLDLFPVREVLGSSRERGDGRVDHAWEFTALPQAAVAYLLTRFLAGGTAVSADVTISTRRHELGNYARFNAQMVLPSVENGDIEYLRGGVLRVTLRFRGLEAL